MKHLDNLCITPPGNNKKRLDDKGVVARNESKKLNTHSSMAVVQDKKGLAINEDLIFSAGTLRLQDSADRKEKSQQSGSCPPIHKSQKLLKEDHDEDADKSGSSLDKEEEEEEGKSPKGVSQSKSRMSKTATLFNTSPSMATTNRYDKKMEDTTPAKRWPKIKDPPPKRESSAQRFYRDFVDQTQRGYKSGILDPDVKPVDLQGLMLDMKD